MMIRGIARIGTCLLTLVVGASSQNVQPFSPGPNQAAAMRMNESMQDLDMYSRIDRADPASRGVEIQPVSVEVRRELQLAGDYLAGRGVPKNAEMAASWYRKAADQGDPAAQNQLGFLYLIGVGVPPDDNQAFKWIARAAGSGFQPARLNLAVMYTQGQGVVRDTSLGLQMLQDLAAEQNPVAQDYLGVAYFTGMGVNIDHSLAEKWFARAARRHDPPAEFHMGMLESSVADHPHDFTRAAAYFRSAARAGYVPAMHSLGLILLRNPDLLHQPDEAEKAFVTASQAGNLRSSIVLGILARDGTGRAVDRAEAFRWFLIAAGQGGPEAQKMLANDLAVCRAALDPAVQAQQQQQADAWLQQYRAKVSFVFGDRFRNRAFPIAEIPQPLSLTTLN